VLRKMSFLAGLLWVLIPSAPAWTQDQPSLGDVARQARKDKEKNKAQAAKVITDDTLPSSKGLSGLALGDLGSAPGSDAGGAMARALAGLEQAEGALNKLGPMDRATLGKAALLENDVDFPNRRNWEDRLYAAKEQYVSHGRELFREMRQILADAQALKASQDGQKKLSPDDPRAQQMLRRIQEIMEDAVRTDRAYQSVVVEGWDLAKQARH
jgi:hypothetical protein